MNKKTKMKKAVAVQYDSREISPKVIAKGAGIVADNIIEKASESKVPIYEDASLVESLTKVEIGQAIPPELYEIVAEVLVFVSDLDELKNRVGG